MTDEIDGIIAKLSAGQREVVRMEGYALGRMQFCAQIMRPLVRRGLFNRVVRPGFLTRWHLTDVGLRVRSRLSNNQVQHG